MDLKEIAKKYPIENLYSDKLIRIGNKLKGRCPFHKDSTNPNFFIYTDTNSWYCFVCGKGGDSINFYMRLHDVDFKSAIKKLGKTR